MEKIRIQRNVKRIEVNDNGDVLELNFDDLNLPYRFYAMLKDFEKNREKFTKGFTEKIKDMSDEESVDAFVQAERELNEYMRDSVDSVFGEGTCRKVYGDILPSVEMHNKFFNALHPFFEEEARRRQAKMNKYSARRMGNVKHHS